MHVFYYLHRPSIEYWFRWSGTCASQATWFADSVRLLHLWFAPALGLSLILDAGNLAISWKLTRWIGVHRWISMLTAVVADISLHYILVTDVFWISYCCCTYIRKCFTILCYMISCTETTGHTIGSLYMNIIDLLHFCWLTCHITTCNLLCHKTYLFTWAPWKPNSRQHKSNNNSRQYSACPTYSNEPAAPFISCCCRHDEKCYCQQFATVLITKSCTCTCKRTYTITNMLMFCCLLCLNLRNSWNKGIKISGTFNGCIISLVICRCTHKQKLAPAVTRERTQSTNMLMLVCVLY